MRCGQSDSCEGLSPADTTRGPPTRCLTQVLASDWSTVQCSLSKGVVPAPSRQWQQHTQPQRSLTALQIYQVAATQASTEVPDCAAATTQSLATCSFAAMLARIFNCAERIYHEGCYVQQG